MTITRDIAVKCPVCEGSCKSKLRKKCASCEGRGYIMGKEVISSEPEVGPVYVPTMFPSIEYPPNYPWYTTTCTIPYSISDGNAS